MPQVIFRYTPEFRVSAEILSGFAQGVRKLVASAASTDKIQLAVDDIDWLPQANERGAIAPDYAIEIVTIGYPDRKAKMNRETMLKLKTDIVELAGFIPKDTPLIWVHFLDPDGVHV